MGIFDNRTISIPTHLRKLYADIRRLEIDLACLFEGRVAPDKDAQDAMKRPHLAVWKGFVPFEIARTALLDLSEVKSSYISGLKMHEKETRADDRPTGAFPSISDQSMSPPFFVTRFGRVSFDETTTPDRFAAIERDYATKVTLSETRAWRVGDHNPDDAVAYLSAVVQMREAQMQIAPTFSVISDWLTAKVGIEALPHVAEAVLTHTGEPIAFRLSSGTRRQYRAIFAGDERSAFTFSIPNVAIIRADNRVSVVPAHKRKRGSAVVLLCLWGRLGLFVTTRIDALERRVSEIIAEANERIRATVAPGLLAILGNNAGGGE